MEILSLPGAPLSRSADNTSAFGLLIGALVAIMEPLYGLTSLRAFKCKFKPRTQPLCLAVSGPASLAAVGLIILHVYVSHVSPAQILTFVTSVAGSLAKLVTKGVGDLRSTRAISWESTSVADTLATTTSSDGSGKEHRRVPWGTSPSPHPRPSW